MARSKLMTCIIVSYLCVHCHLGIAETLEQQLKREQKAAEAIRSTYTEKLGATLRYYFDRVPETGLREFERNFKYEGPSLVPEEDADGFLKSTDSNCERGTMHQRETLEIENENASQFNGQSPERIAESRIRKSSRATRSIPNIAVTASSQVKERVTIEKNGCKVLPEEQRKINDARENLKRLQRGLSEVIKLSEAIDVAEIKLRATGTRIYEQEREASKICQPDSDENNNAQWSHRPTYQFFPQFSSPLKTQSSEGNPSECTSSVSANAIYSTNCPAPQN